MEPNLAVPGKEKGMHYTIWEALGGIWKTFGGLLGTPSILIFDSPPPNDLRLPYSGGGNKQNDTETFEFTDLGTTFG